MNTAFILAMIGPPEIIIIAILVLLIFGGRKIPELMRGLGKGMKEFKEAQKDDETKPSADTAKNQE
jgi:sec-independent protein translocase protein TatA